MSVYIPATDHASWTTFGLPDDCLDHATYCNQSPDYGDSLAGDWFASFGPDDQPIIDKSGNRWLAIVSGTFANDHSPGASHYTQANLYNPHDPTDLAAFRENLASWEAYPEFLDDGSDDPDDDDQDDPDDDGLIYPT